MIYHCHKVLLVRRLFFVNENLEGNVEVWMGLRCGGIKGIRSPVPPIHIHTSKYKKLKNFTRHSKLTQVAEGLGELYISGEW